MAAAGDQRRRRLTLPPNGLALGGESSSPTLASGGSRFSSLREGVSSDEEDCLSEVLFDAAMDVLEEEFEKEPQVGWTTVMKKGRRSDEELRQEFWNEIGFPTPASRTWERLG